MTSKALRLYGSDLTLSSDSLSLSGYMANVQDIPLISAEEEQALFQRFKENNDLEAASTLVMSHLRFVVYIAKSYIGYGIPLEDLIQEGNLGLMKSVKKFDTSRGTRLLTCAVYWIKSQIHEYIQKNWRIVKTITSKAQRKLFLHLNKYQKKGIWFSDNEASDIAKELDVTVDDVFKMEKHLKHRDNYIDEFGDEDQNTDPLRAPQKYLSDQSLEPLSMIESQSTQDLSKSMINGAITNLDQRSQDIITKRWLSLQKQKLKDLSAQYGISIERIRQIENEALRKMKTYFEQNNLTQNLQFES